MKGSDFLSLFSSRSPAAWESAAVDMARRLDSVTPWGLVTIHLTHPSLPGRALDVDVASDVFAIGEDVEDKLRLPLTPTNAQLVADVFGMMLPTTKISREIHRQASIKLTPHGLTCPVNRGPNLAQYADQNARIEQAIAEDVNAHGYVGDLVSGHKKDIVASNIRKAGKVVIYGWGQLPNPPADEAKNRLSLDAPWRVQALSNVHGDFYVDYSHGVRLVSPDARLDGAPVDLRDVLRDPELSALVSDEGPIADVRYPTPGKPSPARAWVGTRPRLVDLGRDVVQKRVERENRS